MCKTTNASKGNNRVPTDQPSFTIGDLKNAIPAHCFVRSPIKSGLYLLRDLLICGSLYYLSSKYLEDSTWPLAVILWPAYWFIQGTFQTGLWVIGHECGHQAFASSQLINDSVGFIVHSALLVPYFSWKISHGKHHSKTGSVDLDEVFVPLTRSEVNPDSAFYHSAPLRFFRIVLMLVLGWPMYLLWNAGGRKYNGWANHFMPSSPVFQKKERMLILASDVGIGLALACLYYLAQAHSWGWVARIYVGPLVFTNFWLVLYTDLQHTDTIVPHYRGQEWNWLRGALATVDRYYGVFSWMHHNIGDTHVLHHLFSKIPHYHAMEATEKIKPILGKYYAYSDENILLALWRTFRECVFVEDAGGVLWYKQH
eukprot:TRINITY_DN8232_c0_g1::TRINITY_DN8232_c0_g1_i1::g.10249::m.10249 TRINITY_DN8232_c0_g1::TRINITY_DN8232_c0_g1_i1::g.10249  ORF type:complete len:394 (+),score=16.01,sp/Q9AT72/FAD2_CALOF/48.94/6e-124,FA_desaturase/PF00487.19/9.6e-30,DUF3474/PF11960.3/2.5e-07 TRINITY_DN8232_c0_g1_i1:79-1182(+)